MHKTATLLAVLAFLFLAVLPVVAIAADESITLTTYYPSPYGVYRQLKINPSNFSGELQPVTAGTTCSDAGEGTMAYSNNPIASSGLYICTYSATTPNPQWKLLSTGAAAASWWAESTTAGDIYNTNTAGNARVRIGGAATDTTNHKFQVNSGNIGLGADQYVNWGAIDGSGGYGIGDVSGVMSYKNSGQAWKPIGRTLSCGQTAVKTCLASYTCTDSCPVGQTAVGGWCLVSDYKIGGQGVQGNGYYCFHNTQAAGSWLEVTTTCCNN